MPSVCQPPNPSSLRQSQGLIPFVGVLTLAEALSALEWLSEPVIGILAPHSLYAHARTHENGPCHGLKVS